MKIAYLSTFYPFRGGIAQFNAALFREFEKQHEIRAYTFSTQYPNLLFPGKTQFVQKGDNADIINSRRILNTVNPISYISTVDEIRNFSPEIMITKFWMPFFAPSLGYVSGKIKKNAKVISILDNVIPHELRFGDMNLIKYFLNKNNGFVVMSEAVKKDLLHINPNSKYLMHPHPLYDHFGVKLRHREARVELGLPVDKKILLCFGFIRDYKGIDLAISAISKLGDDYHLVIAGEVYGNFEKYEKIIDEYNVRKRVSLFTRYISDEETSFFFSAADACILPYKSATQSGIVAIAYHFDLPVIATNVGGLAEMITPYKAGLMAQKPDADSITDAVKKFFKLNRNEFIENIQKYKELASWERLADSIIKFAGEIN